MNYLKQIENELNRSGGIITTMYLRSKSIPRVYLTRLTREGKLKRIDRGIYISKDGIYDELFATQTKYPKIIFSYETALQLMNLTDKIPAKINVTVNKNYKFNKKPENLKVNYVNDEIYELGVVDGESKFGNPVRFYSAERTLCDFIKNKSNMDSEVYLSFIKTYPSYKNRDIHTLFFIAQKMNIVQEVQDIMELVYE